MSRSLVLGKIPLQSLIKVRGNRKEPLVGGKKILILGTRWHIAHPPRAWEGLAPDWWLC